jgi:hypothetical protein
LGVDISSVDVLGVDISSVNISSVNILSVDISSVDILRYSHFNLLTTFATYSPVIKTKLAYPDLKLAHLFVLEVKMFQYNNKRPILGQALQVPDQNFVLRTGL